MPDLPTPGRRYRLPDGTLLRARLSLATNLPELCDDAGTPLYLVAPWRIYRLVPDRTLPGVLHARPCDLVLDDLQEEG